jgi:hypothetical protein
VFVVVGHTSTTEGRYQRDSGRIRTTPPPAEQPNTFVAQGASRHTP